MMVRKTALAVLLPVLVITVVGVAGGIYLVTATGPSSSNPNSSTKTPSVLQFRTTSMTTVLPLPVLNGTAPNGAEQWIPGLAVEAALTSPQAQSYIKMAYSYSILGLSQTSASPIMISVLLNVTGSQSVIGNWAAGYTVSYTKLNYLNVIVQFTKPSNYTVVRVWATQSPDRIRSIDFTPTQQNVIRVLLSNATIAQALRPAFYVESVSVFPIANGTYGGDYFVYLHQLNGTRTIGAFVNQGMTAVIASYTDSRTATFCYASVSNSFACFVSPWNSARASLE
jgi:hypothetical protein